MMVQKLYHDGTVSVPPWKIVFRSRSGFAGILGRVFIVWFFDAFLQVSNRAGWSKMHAVTWHESGKLSASETLAIFRTKRDASTSWVANVGDVYASHFFRTRR